MIHSSNAKLSSTGAIVTSDSSARKTKKNKKNKKSNNKAMYEIWGSDQSNSISGNTSAGTNGSYLWIWDGNAINDEAAMPLACAPGSANGPCDLWDVFPTSLTSNGATLNDKFGRLHGMLKDPQNKYVTANIFAPGKYHFVVVIHYRDGNCF